ncbi:hypothetical protein NLJ89_g12148 [Agrocybe chaxingu]|uniref:Uncharacterized protein n=1 Tax=Agrocybe chaxingu TaxID=84603 RepID=A0A9W8MME4_9AGAR|nr:hypothetical protein NLJ89_g12148 [Agrocybe chaxingu]
MVVVAVAGLEVAGWCTALNHTSEYRQDSGRAVAKVVEQEHMGIDFVAGYRTGKGQEARSAGSSLVVVVSVNWLELAKAAGAVEAEEEEIVAYLSGSSMQKHCQETVLIGAVGAVVQAASQPTEEMMRIQTASSPSPASPPTPRAL